MCFELLHSLPLQNRTSTKYIDDFTSKCRWCLRHLTSLLITLAWLTLYGISVSHMNTDMFRLS